MARYSGRARGNEEPGGGGRCGDALHLLHGLGRPLGARVGNEGVRAENQ